MKVKRAVLFDLYGTLVRRRSDKADPLESPLRNVYCFLQSRGCNVDFEHFRKIDEEVFTRLLNRGKVTLQEIDLRQAYMEILPKVGVPTADDIINGCISAFGKPTEDCFCELWPEVDYVLKVLRERGYVLAVVSNVQAVYARRDLCQLGILHLFDAIVFSSEVGWVKPHKAMFQTALEKLGVDVSRAVMVGDTFEEDIIGAKKLGLKAVLVTRMEEQHTPLNNLNIRPDLTISNLQELIEYLDDLI